MTINLFKPKKSSFLKGNTIKKAEPIDGRQGRGDFHAEDDARVESAVDLLNVCDWLKENTVEGPKKAELRDCAVLWDQKGPCKPTLVDESATQMKATRKEETGERDGGIKSMAGPTIEHEKAEKSEPPMLDLLCSQQHTSLRYFTKTYLRVPAFAVPDAPSSSFEMDTALLQLPELDPHAFHLLSSFFGAYEPSPATEHRYPWQTCWPLMNAQILGSNIQAIAFADKVMDSLGGYLSHKICADVDTINHIFSKDDKEISRVLKHFVVDQCIDVAIERDTCLDMTSLPPTFAHLMVERALRRLSSTSASTEPSCKYHLHETPEQCYKNNVRPSEVRRQEWLKLNRDKARAEAEEVIKDTKMNGIKAVDWAMQRAVTCEVWSQTTGQMRAEASNTRAKVKSEPLVPAGDLFGTTQSNNAVDDVLSIE